MVWECRGFAYQYLDTLFGMCIRYETAQVPAKPKRKGKNFILRDIFSLLCGSKGSKTTANFYFYLVLQKMYIVQQLHVKQRDSWGAMKGSMGGVRAKKREKDSRKGADKNS